MKPPDLLSAIKPVVESFEQLGVLYYIGGSVASSAYGFARATLDVDLVTNLKSKQVRQLVKMLKSAYYVNEKMIYEAIQNSSSFNLIHLDTMLKVDVFIEKEGPYASEVFKRKRSDTLDEDEKSIKFYLASAEDIILKKLDWFRRGGSVSERQWYDITGVIKVQEDELNWEYLRYWATKLSLIKLLQQACKDAGAELI